MTVAVATAGARSRALAYLELTKPRIVFLVLLTGVPALLLAAGGFPPWTTVLGAIGGTALAAASAAAFNHYFDRDLDARMARTRARPLPMGRIAPVEALTFAFVLAALAWIVLSQMANTLAALLGMASIVYYALVYTVWLKRSTPQNIVIGGGAGATAPLIAWAAVTGDVGLPAVLLGAIVFMWTPPHFWSLALYRRDDYARAGIPMLPVTHGDHETRRQIVLYTLCLVPVTIAPAALGLAGPLYWVPAASLGLAFLYFAWRLLVTAETARAVRLFRFSIAYLFVLFAALGVDAGLGSPGAPRGARAAATAATDRAALSPVPLRVRFAPPSSHRIAADHVVRGTPHVPYVMGRRGEAIVARYRVTNAGPVDVVVCGVPRVEPGSVRRLVHAEGQLDCAAGGQRVPAGQSRDVEVRVMPDTALPAELEEIVVGYELRASRAD